MFSIAIMALMATQTAVADTTQTQLPLDSLGSGYTDLDELVIEARKDVVKSDGATLTYDLDADESSKGMSVLDALKKVPMVTVDGQDKIYIKGSNNFKIYVNGKEDRMLEENAAQILKSMPSESVAQIEVITEPGAKYDAEGIGGILNLITERKQRFEGYSGSVNASASNRNYGAGGFASLKVNKIHADLSVNYMDNHGLPQENLDHGENINYDSVDSYRKVTDSYQKTLFRFVNTSLNMSWEPNDRNLFTWGGSYLWLNATIDEMRQSTSMFARNGVEMWSFSQDFTGRMRNIGATGNASWRHNIGDNGQRFILAYNFSFGRTGLDIFSHNSSGADYADMSPWSESDNTNYTREHTVQADYTNPFGGRTHLLETGVKGIFRRNSALSGTWMGADRDHLSPIEAERVDAGQFQDVYAVYGSYTGNFGKVSTKAGVRYEHTYMGMNFHIGDYADFSSHLNDVVPNAAITYLFSPTQNLRLAYQMRISRPEINQLNPYRMTIVETNVQYGNPDLKSEHHNNVSLTYSNYGRVLGGYVGVEYSQTDNAIMNYTFQQNDIFYKTYGNDGKTRKVSLNGFLNINISNRMSVSVNGTVDYTDMRAPGLGLANSGWGGNYGINWSYMGPWGLKMSAYGGQMLHRINIDGYWGGTYYYGLGIKRSFLSDKLTVGITASDFCQAYRGITAVTQGPDWKTTNRYQYKSWSVGVNISWTFGKMTERAKTTEIDLTNSDASSAGNNGNGGGGMINL